MDDEWGEKMGEGGEKHRDIQRRAGNDKDRGVEKQ
jgi:hypothetical protein